MNRHLIALTAVSIIGTSVILINSQTALAISVEQIVSNAKAGVVRIDNLKSNGSGFIVKRVRDTYTVVTNRHVVAADGVYEITTSDNKKHRAISITKFAEVDLAEVEFVSDASYKILELDISSSLYGLSFYLTGYPGEQKYSLGGLRDFQYFDLKHSGNPQSIPDGYTLSFVGEALSGMSGSPIVASNGKVVAIFGKYQSSNTGKADIAYGIPSQTYLGKGSLRVATVRDKNSPPDADSFLARGNDLFSTDKKAAIEAYKQAIRLKPDFSTAYLNRGLAKATLKDYQGALADYNEAIRINPQFANAYLNRGDTKYTLKDYQGALADFDEAIRINPQFANAYLWRGNAKYILEDYQGAVSEYNEAIRINPQFANAYLNRGSTKFILKDYQGAVSEYNEAIRINPQYTSAYLSRGNAKSVLGDKQGALADFDEAIKINPQYDNAYYDRGFAKFELGDKQGALADFDEAIKINPQYDNAYYGRGLTKYVLGDKQGALVDYNQAIRINPRDAIYYDRGYRKSLSVFLEGATERFIK